MVRSGTVIRVDAFSNSGMIRDEKGREFYFHLQECCENKLPRLYSVVTFIKDQDFKSTDVAALIQPSHVFNSYVS